MEELTHQRGELRRELEEATLRHAAELRDLQARKEEITARLQVRRGSASIDHVADVVQSPSTAGRSRGEALIGSSC